MRNVIVVTGPPSCGKKGIIAKLKEKGYNTYDCGIKTFLNQRKEEGLDLKSIQGNLKEYQKNILEAQILVEKKINRDLADNPQNNNPAIVSSSLFDNFVYFNKYKLDPGIIIETCEKEGISLDNRRYSKIFLLEPLYKKFEWGDPRKDKRERNAEILYSIMQNTYLRQGYKIIKVKAMSLDQRIDLIIENIENGKNNS